MISASEQVASRSINALVSELKYVSSETFLRGLNINSYKEEILSELLSHFPPPRFENQSSVNEFGGHLYSGWKSKLEFSGSKASAIIFNTFAANSRAAEVIRYLNRGTGRWEFSPEEDLKVLLPNNGKRTPPGKGAFNWVTLAQGRVFVHAPRAGLGFVSKTEAFIRSHIFPELRKDIHDKVAARMKRVK